MKAAPLRRYLVGYLFLVLLIPGHAEDNPGLQDEIMLHPLDSFTAFTLKKKEFIYNQSPFTLPFPSWLWWGINDKVSMEIDTLPLIGGFFQEPYLPVPSVNFRFRLRDGGRTGVSLAYETMFQYLYVDQKQIETDHLQTIRRGTSWFNRLNASVPLGPRSWAHFSAGETLTNHLTIENKDRPEYHGDSFHNEVHPDVSLGWDFRMKPSLTLHAAVSYGTTFVYLDNVPRKFQVSYGFRTAPFLKSRKAFLRNMRAEFAAFYIHFSDAKEEVSSPLPVFPYFYWQWML